jgi:6-phosphofructokinase 1
MDLAYILKRRVEERFAGRKKRITLVHKTIGYEVRCAPPVAFDCEYVRALGYGAVKFLLNPDHEAAKIGGAMVCLDEGKLRYLKFDDLLDPRTEKTRVRRVDVSKTSYLIAREYMIRLEQEDFEDQEKLKALAKAASSDKKAYSPEEFKKKFQYLVTDFHAHT